MYFGYPSSLREGGGSFQALDKARDLTSMVTIYRHIVSNNVENLTASNHKLSCALRVSPAVGRLEIHPLANKSSPPLLSWTLR
ncbi:hypothetical protein AU210_006460 [Fusarium oxysporum f. sp. radicis-cucumerinum]|uniref:Uncharacterized protein n=1 Tax=Fusarium oxysporum f. sp. radicis-cucumerinum TaxID=327505 RepID=A0A2H3H7H1_FUSOX|nr:hypothetical protein AU210_006460 [Fusarium oxysporum f. sp. radicis-cucumerinum]